MNPFSQIFSASHVGPRTYALGDERIILIDKLNEIANHAYEFAKNQLSLPFDEKYEARPILDFTEALGDIKLLVTESNSNLDELRIRIVLNVDEDDDHILFLENFAQVIDQNLLEITKPIRQSLAEKIRVAEARASQKLEEFYSGARAMSIVRNLRVSSQPDVVRLAKWIEQNWNNFNNVEKEVAFYQYLIPTQSSGDYVHRDELDAPRFWDSNVQRHPNADTTYRWTGPSIKDAAPYTNPDAPIGSGLADEGLKDLDEL